MNHEIDLILSRLTLREKIGQTVQLPVESVDLTSDDAACEFFAGYPIGSLFAGPDIIQKFGAKIHRAEALERCQKLSKVPLSVAGDLERGWGAANFPFELSLAATRDLSLAYEYGRWTAIEGRKAGFTWAFAPVADLALNWLNPAVNHRCLGDDPELAAAMLAEIVKGMQDHWMSPAAKHFPGDGVDFRDQHLSLSVNSLTRERWEETFGKVYRRLFEINVHSIMTGHIALPFIDPPTGDDIALPATLSAKIGRNFLRDELKFAGVVVSDALIMSGFVMHKPYQKRLIQSFLAGTDVMLWPELDYFDLMEQAINDGTVPESLLDAAVRRILRMKEQQGLLHNKSVAKLPDPVPSLAGRNADPAAIAAEIAERGAVLVRNRKQLLPLVKARTKKVLLWCAAVNQRYGGDYYQILRDEFTARGAEVELAVNGNCLDLYQRERAGERYDAVIFLFCQGMHDVKNTIRPVGNAAECLWTLNCTEHHSPIVVALKSPYLLFENPALDTVVNMHSDGVAVLRAIPRLLYGEIPFTGVSPVSLELNNLIR